VALTTIFQSAYSKASKEDTEAHPYMAE